MPPIEALAYLLPVILWAIIAENGWHFRLRYRPRSGLYRVMPFLTTTFALTQLNELVLALLLPVPSTARALRWLDLTDVGSAFAAAQFRHLAWYFQLSAAPPTGRWLALTYGSAALVGFINLFPELVPASSIERQITIARLMLVPYVFGSLLLGLSHLRGFALPGGWRPGSIVARYADVRVISLGVLLAGALYLWFAVAFGPRPTGGFVQPPPLLNAAIGVLFAIPFAARMLGFLIKRTVLVAIVVLAMGSVYAVAQTLGARLERPEVAAMFAVGALSALALVLMGIHPWLDETVDRLLLRRRRRRRLALRAFIQTLSPEVGAQACCQRVVDELVRIMSLRGAAIVLTEQRGVARAGTMSLEPLLRVGVDGPEFAQVAHRPQSLASFRDLPGRLQAALVEAEVTGMLPIVSPRQLWGFAVATAGPLASSIEDADRDELQAVANQLARLLDATELIDRAVAVERSLAQAEKLAAIGETAARIAHEIRNPAAAARSLAQQLVREPAAPDAAESAALILAELERVEHQVASLLRFARREEYRFEPVDVGGLVSATLGAFRARLAAGRIELETDCRDGVVARADREKLRQVVINLVENAIDALAAPREGEACPEPSRRACPEPSRRAPAEPRLAVTVAGVNGHATIRVSDNGPGVPAEALEKMFEPFFSLKEKGTGLGLAIVKRTVEAHGGRIVAESVPAGGMSFELNVPLAPRSAMSDEQ